MAGSFDPDAALMVGYSDQEGTLEFHHAVSYLLVNVITSDSRSFKSLSVTGNASERMSGDFSVDFSTLEVSSDATDGTYTSVSGGQQSLASGEAIMIAIPARTYEKVFH